MDQPPRTSSWSPTWESVCCSASCVPARPNILMPLSSPQTIMPSMILLSKAVAFAMDMLITVHQPGVTNPANRRPITWWAVLSWILWTYSLQVHNTPPRRSSCTVCSVVKTYWDVVSRRSLPMASFCLHFYLFYVVRLGVEGLGFCSHHSFVTQLCTGMCCWGWRLQWRLDIRPQLYLPLQGFKDVETLIMVFSLMLKQPIVSVMLFSLL